MSQQIYNIGQIVYILFETKQVIIPAMVCEEHTTHTLQGTDTTWKISVGEAGKSKILDMLKINTIGGQLFTSIDEIKELQTKKFLKYLDEIINMAKQKEKLWYENIQKASTQTNPEVIPESNNFDEIQNQIINDSGISEFLSIDDKKSIIQQKLKKTIMPTTEELNSISKDEYIGDNKFIIDGPNGTKLVANFKV